MCCCAILVLRLFHNLFIGHCFNLWFANNNCPEIVIIHIQYMDIYIYCESKKKVWNSNEAVNGGIVWRSFEETKSWLMNYDCALKTEEDMTKEVSLFWYIEVNGNCVTLSADFTTQIMCNFVSTSGISLENFWLSVYMHKRFMSTFGSPIAGIWLYYCLLWQA